MPSGTLDDVTIYVFGGGAEIVETQHLRDLSVFLDGAIDEANRALADLGAAVMTVTAESATAPANAERARGRIIDALNGVVSVTAFRKRCRDLREALALAVEQYEAAEETVGAVLARQAETVAPLAWYEAIWNTGPAAEAPAVWDRELAVGGTLGAGFDLWRALTAPEGRNATTQQALARVAGRLGGLINPLGVTAGDDVGRARGSVAPVPFVAGSLLGVTGFDHFHGNVGVSLSRSDGGSEGVAEYRDEDEVWARGLDAGDGQSVEPISDYAELIEYSEGLAAESREAGAGRIGVLRNQAPDGAVSWLMVIPGTREKFAHPNPQDYLSNLQMMADQSDDLVPALGAALRSLPIGRNDTVSLIGHSQGGIAAAELAADPRLREAVRIDHVVTLGSPVGQIGGIPEETRVTNLESSRDFVPALDGLANTNSENHMTVVFDAKEPIEGSWHPHDLASYHHGLEASIAADEHVAAQFQAFEEAVGWGKEGAPSPSSSSSTTQFVFEFERTDLADAWQRVRDHLGYRD